MTSKELLIQEIETLPPELLTEALNFIREIKTSHTAKQSSTNNLRGSTAEDLLEFAGTWSGDDIRECLQLVHDTRMPLEFFEPKIVIGIAAFSPHGLLIY